MDEITFTFSEFIFQKKRSAYWGFGPINNVQEFPVDVSPCVIAGIWTVCVFVCVCVLCLAPTGVCVCMSFFYLCIVLHNQRDSTSATETLCSVHEQKACSEEDVRVARCRFQVSGRRKKTQKTGVAFFKKDSYFSCS